MYRKSVSSSRSYARLDENERELISRGLLRGRAMSRIARELGRSPSTVVREAARNRGRHPYYCGDCAGRQARARAASRRAGCRKLEHNARLRAYVLTRLRWRWSPEQIARQLAADYPEDMAMRVSHESIYAWVYVRPKGELKRTLIRTLRRTHAFRRRRGRRKTQDTNGRIPNMALIDERPAEAEGREVPGHWEGDLVRGKYNRSAVGTLTERATRFAFLVPLKSAETEEVRRAFARTFRTLPAHLRRSLTYDQGKEMTEHEAFARHSGMAVYFAHRKSPWERGTNENFNGLVRDFFPKGTDFSRVSNRELKRVQRLLNERPRKVLGWKTPQESLQSLLR